MNFPVIHAHARNIAQRSVRLVALLILANTMPAAHAEPLRMSFLSPDTEGQFWFWEQTTRFMRAAAEDLDIQFDVVRTQTISTYAVKKDALSILDRDEPPDYILTGYWNQSVRDLLESSRDSGIELFLFNTPVSDADSAILGQPRGQFKHWIGHMHPDDAQGGYRLARILFKHARRPAAQRPTIHAAGLTGDVLSTVSNARESGLRRAVDEQDAVLNTTVATAWRRDAAERATAGIVTDHPDTSVIWTVSDMTALGVINALKRRGLEPGKDVVTGGFDWSPEGLAAVRRGEMAATMGGHFMEGVRAMILTYDYHHGLDFADRPGTTINTPLEAVTAENVEQYTTILNSDGIEKIDFRQLSRRHNPDLGDYDFSPAGLMKRLRRCNKQDSCE